MDPQATFRRILEAQAANDRDEFDQAFHDLAEWLKRGGFAPVVSDLGWATIKTAHGEEKKRREYLRSSNERYAIMTKVAGELGAFVFVIYNPPGKEIKRFDMRTAV